MSGDVILNWLHQYRPNRTGVVMLTSNDTRQESDSAENIHQLHGVVFNDFELTVDHCEQLVKLTEREYQLAKLFFNNVGLNLSRKTILDTIWFQDSLESNRSLTTHIHNLRIKLDLTIENGWVLRPVYGFGYRLDRLSGES
jgi:DNA-binding response OmpR family regulator